MRRLSASMKRITIAATMAVIALSSAGESSGTMREQGVNFQGVNFQGVNFQGVNFQGVNFQGVNFQGVNFQGVNFQGVNSQGVNFQGVNFQGVNFQGVNFQGVNFQGINPQGVNFQGVNFQGVNFQGVNFQGVNFQGMNFQGVNFQGVNFQGVNFQGIDWQGVNFQGVNFQGVNFQGIPMRGVDLVATVELPTVAMGAMAINDVGAQQVGLRRSFSDPRDGTFIRVGDHESIAGTFWTAPIGNDTGSGVLNFYVASQELDVGTKNDSIFPGNDDVYLYNVYFLHPATGRWHSLCPTDSTGRPNAVAVPVDLVQRSDRSQFTFACTATGVAAKCARNWGYKPWKAGDADSPGVNWKKLYEACLISARADYCQDGTSFTRNGTLVDLFDGKVTKSAGWAYVPNSDGIMLHEEYQVSTEKTVGALLLQDDPALLMSLSDEDRNLVNGLHVSGLQSSRYPDLDPGRQCRAAPFIDRCEPNEPYSCVRAANLLTSAYGDFVAVNSPRHCTHSDDELGDPLDPLCNACVNRVCSINPTCCGERGSDTDVASLTWSQECKDLRQKVCKIAQDGTPVWKPGKAADNRNDAELVYPRGAIGALESVSADRFIEGWACDPDHPSASVPLQISVGGGIAEASRPTKIIADQPLSESWRKLVSRECGDAAGGALHGFRYQLPAASAGKAVYVFAVDIDQAGAPLTLVRGGVRKVPASPTTPGVTIPAGGFLGLWTGWVEPVQGGMYSFTLETEDDDDYRIWVNGWLVGSRWPAGFVQPPPAPPSFDEPVRESQYLLPGVRYAVRVEMGSRGASAKARLKWARDGGAPSVIDKENLYPLVQSEGRGFEVLAFDNPADVDATATVGSPPRSNWKIECKPEAGFDCRWTDPPLTASTNGDYGLRIRGQIVAPFSGDYLFTADTDESVEISVFGQRVTDLGNPRPPLDKATCSHDICEPGAALNRACRQGNSCAEWVCLRDPFCCALTWDARCVEQVKTACNVNCTTAPPVPIRLIGGIKYDVEVRYKHRTPRPGRLKLMWAVPGASRDVVPRSRAFAAQTPLAAGTGLNAMYFPDGTTYTDILQRTDGKIDFDTLADPRPISDRPSATMVCGSGACGPGADKPGVPVVIAPVTTRY